VTISRAAHETTDGTDRRLQARRGIDAIDMVLEAVEQHHLAGRPRRVPPLPVWIAWLEQDGGLSVPASILEMTNTVKLHGALLDWQDQLLSTALPDRARLARADEEHEAEQRRLSIWGDVA
jgi:hypothetical protein